MAAGVVAVLTDFGASEYVGVMHGVLLRVYPQCRVVDLFHNVSPQCVREGAWLLLSAFSFFPARTVFLAVVDPGVGSFRRAIAVETKNGSFFVGPDNGLLFPALLGDGGVLRAVALRVPTSASATFHGRDVFAPAAARIAAGADLSELGSAIESSSLKELRFRSELLQNDRKSFGEVVHVDRFGNVVTSAPLPCGLPESAFAVVVVEVSDHHGGDENLLRLAFSRTYAAAPPAPEVFAIGGSSATFELSVQNGNASQALPPWLASVGTQICFRF